jgi:predicted ATP-dependent endonuclease of OLD family
MNLIKLSVNGYRRFSEKTTMNLDGKLIAILGPNEAGKTSFLNLLQHLNDGTPFVGTGGAQDLSRDQVISSNQDIIDATFLLDDSDRQQVKDIEDTKKIRWLLIQKKSSGGFYAQLVPKPSRNLEPRKKLVKRLKDALARMVESENEDESEELKAQIDGIDSVVSILDVDDEQLDTEEIEEIRTLATLLDSDAANQDLGNVLTQLADAESSNPHDRAMQHLFKLRPKVLLFDRPSRDLHPFYDLEKCETDTPSALTNLFNLAELSLNDLLTHIRNEDEGRVDTYISKANEKLKDIFTKSWTQTEVTLRLRITGSQLHILIDEKERNFHSIAERSDGLRQYVALLLFLALEKTSQPPILLVDEAETHLHYDAQADLVQMLARQDVAAKVVYTTHSIGCLPEDLGAGVRLIDPNTPNTSIVHNWFWESAQAGFSPLLFGMGAKTLAFLPVRYALVTEGATDMILIPSLLREATRRSYLGFQTVPGISESDDERLAILENGAPRTVYLTDNDEAGGKLRRQLNRVGIPETRIFSLPGEAPGLVIEDFIIPMVYVNAVNQELSRSYGGQYIFSEEDLPDVNRPRKIDDWCKGQGIQAPNKRSICYRILEAKEDGPILTGKYRASLKALFTKIEHALETNKSARK